MAALAAVLAVALGLGPVPGAPGSGEAAAQGLNVLRNTGRTVERSIREQVRRALKPTLTVRNAYDAPPGAIAVSPDLSYLAVVSGGGDLRIFDLVNGRQAARHAGPGGAVKAVALGPGGAPFVVLTGAASTRPSP
ncbi:MAG: hypothetical protein AAFR52_06980, partial [Pseudomonadota bacterium]